MLLCLPNDIVDLDMALSLQFKLVYYNGMFRCLITKILSIVLFFWKIASIHLGNSDKLINQVQSPYLGIFVIPFCLVALLGEAMDNACIFLFMQLSGNICRSQTVFLPSSISWLVSFTIYLGLAFLLALLSFRFLVSITFAVGLKF